jgi:peptide/nickel transport system substrate-binding protein
MRPRLLAAAVVGALAISFVFLALRSVTREVPAPVEPKGEVIVAYPDEPASLNPYAYEGDTNATRDLLRPLLPTLLTIDPDLRYLPGVATRVPSGKDITAQPFSVTFHIDAKARWSDGIPITAEDVRFTWETIRDPNQPIADRSAYERISDVVVVDRRTFRLTFDQPYPAWRDLFSAGDFILPKHALAGKDLAAELIDGPPVSGGPFVLEEWVPGLQVTYRANPQWWGDGPGFELIRVFFVPDIETALQLLEGERVQVVAAGTNVNLNRRFERLQGVRAASRFGSAWWELAFNHERAGPSENDWRKAVSTGFNRAGIVEALVRSDGRPLEHLAPGREIKNAFTSLGYDPEGTKESLGRAGFVADPDGRFRKSGVGAIGISAPADHEMASLVERAIQVGLSGSGIEVEFRNPRATDHYTLWRREGRFDLALWERRGTPFMSLNAFYHSGRHPPGGLNYTRLRSADVDRSLEAAERGTSYRRASIDEVMGQLAASLPALPLFEQKAYLGFRANVTGPSPNATVEGPFWNLHEWALSG